MKKFDFYYFCADQIDVITNIAVITNVGIKRVHCITPRFNIWCKICNYKQYSLFVYSLLSKKQSRNKHLQMCQRKTGQETARDKQIKKEII